jgi:Ca2+-binding EF-hand superfamily protein
MISTFGEPLTEEEAKEVMKNAKPVNGKINYKDFVKVIIKGKLE